MRITQIRQILEIEKCTSISQAARNLFVSQPALSSLLSEFEDEIGVKIFLRAKSGVTPTEDGELILESMKHIMKEVTYIEQYAAVSQELTGTVSFVLGGSYDFLYGDLISRFKSKFPKAQILFSKTYEANMLNCVEKELFDFSILAQLASDEQEILQSAEGKDGRVMRLKDVHSVVVMNPEHPRAKEREIRLSSLLGEQLMFCWQYEVEKIVKYVSFEKYPITNLERGVMLDLIKQNQGILVDTTPLNLEHYKKYYPGAADAAVALLVNDVPGFPDRLLGWSTYFFYRSNTGNKLKKSFLAEIKAVLENYELLV